ncbi:MAG: alanine--tRNA ligase [Cryomorphaceae bacterium]|nr:alanine--tRNA ligase [Cryomorphaceae bacterium]MBT6317723.1 alanine--tRNA ligase [Cryomorphaceae bacterium]
MNSSVVREKFFQYFKDKGHEIIPSASVINKTDKNLMFTNAGMNQFRNIFTGDQDTKFSRVANSQKCLRVSGKHNDLEEVGVDTYHHTFFEMLGNWSFGDYFKKEIIEWSFDLITNVYGLEREDLYVSVFEGSEDDNTEFDKETFDEWKKYFSQDKIINGNKKDNFWEMGDTGPCGPCSEIHIDLRSTAEKKKIKGADLVNKDHPEVVEIWNLVFIQYDRKKDGSLKKLDKQYVDTGMGLERLCMALQGKKSTYETDFFTDTIKEIENISSKKYLGGDESIDIGIRVISDHLRAIIFTILDGQVPGNTGSGYVIRRILRRAIRYGYTNLDIHEPFLFKLVEKVTDKYDDIYPSLRNQQNYVESIIKDEEKGFLKTLNQGLSLINELINTNPTDKIIKGDIAFKLYDTYGFPIDLTSLIATENNFKVDLDGFNENMKIQKNRSKSIKNEEVSDWIIINDNLSSSIFIGYDMDEIDGKIIKYRECKTDQDKVSYHIVTDKTSFYPEGGGQIGDIGQIILGDKKIKVNNTFRDAGEIIHVTIELPNDLNSLIKLKIDRNRRTLIESNHTSTHLLHQALRKILGDHVEQRGSMISDKMFRFDFSHQNKISDSELSNVNNFVNEKINESIDLIEDREEDYQIATKNGAIGLFTEKYEDKVRTIKFNDSYELCGGTHVKNTSDISSFKIISEGSQAFGIRRIVATSNEEVIIAEGLKQRAVKEKTDNENANKLLKKEIESQNKIKIQLIKDDIIKNINNTNDANTFVGEVDLDPKSIKELCFILSDKFENLFLILLSKSDEKVFISCFISKELIEEKELNASKIIKELSPLINGSGGGQSFYATGGGTNINGIDSVIKESKKIISQI